MHNDIQEILLSEEQIQAKIKFSSVCPQKTKELIIKPFYIKL